MRAPPDFSLLSAPSHYALRSMSASAEILLLQSMGRRLRLLSLDLSITAALTYLACRDKRRLRLFPIEIGLGYDLHLWYRGNEFRWKTWIWSYPEHAAAISVTAFVPAYGCCSHQFWVDMRRDPFLYETQHQWRGRSQWTCAQQEY